MHTQYSHTHTRTHAHAHTRAHARAHTRQRTHANACQRMPTHANAGQSFTGVPYDGSDMPAWSAANMVLYLYASIAC